jgi:hypothetical protein
MPTAGLFSAPALASAALSVYRPAGGTSLLDSVAGLIEDAARGASGAAILLGTMTSVAKLGLQYRHHGRAPRSVYSRLPAGPRCST